jgi:hypothetical protein
MLMSAVLDLCTNLHHGSSTVCQQKTLGAIETDSLAHQNFEIITFLRILYCFLMVAEHIVFSAPRTEYLSVSRSSNHLDYIQVSNIIRIINSREMTWAGHVARLDEEEESIQGFGEKSRTKEITRKN